MKDIINKYSMKELSGRDARLWKEWKELDDLYEKRKKESINPRRPSISYIVRRKNVMGLPTEYEIHYRVRSIIGVEDGPAPRKPIFGNLHKMLIRLPSNYPSADGNPEFYFITDIWHPNIRSAGQFKGKVCLTINEMGVLASLKDLVLRVERYLKYKLYHAKNTYPYPEDQDVAEWVREEGEPNGWLHFGTETSASESQASVAQIAPSAQETTAIPEPVQEKVTEVKPTIRTITI